MNDTTEFCMMMTTCNRPDIANAICQALVSEKLAACVHIMPIQAHYTWHEQPVTDNESLLMIKTRSELYDAVAARIISIHDYDTPQVTMMPILNASPAYMEWMRATTAAA